MKGHSLKKRRLGSESYDHPARSPSRDPRAATRRQGGAAVSDLIERLKYEPAVRPSAAAALRTDAIKEIEQLRAENERLRKVPFDRGPDGEPNGPDLGAYVDLQAENERLKEQLAERNKKFSVWRRGSSENEWVISYPQPDQDAVLFDSPELDLSYYVAVSGATEAEIRAAMKAYDEESMRLEQASCISCQYRKVPLEPGDTCNRCGRQR
jgi:hypothetical protein